MNVHEFLEKLGISCLTDGLSDSLSDIKLSDVKENVDPKKEEDLRHKLLDVKIADLGNACWGNRHFTDDIQTRQYRSPEVILGLKYDHSTDMWSLACLVSRIVWLIEKIFELLTGDFLFEPKSADRYDKNEDHLAQMMELLGKMPKLMMTNGKYSSDFFNRKGEMRHIKRLKFWKLPQVLEEKYGFSREDSDSIASFLLPMLHFEPKMRARPSELLRHDWLTE
jgi:serine/threonine-protein kinase SRPK3